VISKRAEALADLGARLQAANTLAQDRELYEKRLAELQKIRQGTEQLLQTWHALREAGVLKGSDRPMNVDGELSAVVELLKAFRKDPQAVNAPVYSSTTERVNTLLGVVRQQFREKWRAYCDDLSPAIQPEVLEVLGRLSSQQEMVGRLQRQRGVVERGRQTLPQTLREVTEVLGAAKIVKMEWSRLAGDDLPPEVLTFLRSVMTQGAALDALTLPVLAWLSDRQLLHLFRITVQGQR